MRKQNRLSSIAFFLFLVLCFISSCLMTTTKKTEYSKKEETMIYIPESEFIMGSQEVVDPAYGVSAFPERTVYVDSFFISKYETTVVQYTEFVLAGGYIDKGYWSKDGWEWLQKNNIIVEEDIDKKKYTDKMEYADKMYLSQDEWEWLQRNKSLLPRSWEKSRDLPSFLKRNANNPVLNISWYEAEAYAWFRKKRLPLEKEWEKAARGVDGRIYPWGNTFDKYKCNVKDSGIGTVLPVGGIAGGVSPYGVYNMCGNAKEWTMSRYYAYGFWLKDVGVIRGGGWDDPSVGARTWSRYLHNKGELRTKHVGIRLSEDAEI